MRRLVLLLAAAACASLGCDDAPRYLSYPVTADTVRVPSGTGTPVLTDGLFSDGEWDDAARLMVTDSITLFFKQYHGHVFLGVHCPDLIVPVFDLFLDPGTGDVTQLHISAQLGERVLKAASPEAEDPEFVWGRTTDWYANEIRWDAARLGEMVEAGIDRDEAFSDVVFPYEGAEFHVRRAKFDTPVWRMRLEIMWHGSYDGPLVFRAGTSRTDSTDWLVLLLE